MQKETQFDLAVAWFEIKFATLNQIQNYTNPVVHVWKEAVSKAFKKNPKQTLWDEV